jgi:hypothetical protein
VSKDKTLAMIQKRLISAETHPPGKKTAKANLNNSKSRKASQPVEAV